MALYYEASIFGVEAVIQNDKSKDKKFYYSKTLGMPIELNAAAATQIATYCYSIPLNSVSVGLENINIYSRKWFIDDTINVPYNNPDEIGLPFPGFRLDLFVGLSDAQIIGVPANITEFNSLNIYFIPCILRSCQDQFNAKMDYDQMLTSKNSLWLNIYAYLDMLTIADITAFVTDFNAIYALKGGVPGLGYWQMNYFINVFGHII